MSDLKNVLKRERQTLWHSGNDGPADHRLLTEQGMKTVMQRIQAIQPPSTRIEVTFTAWWHGDVRWARNRVAMASDRRDVNVRITLQDAQSTAKGTVETNQTDEVSLRGAMGTIERMMQSVSRRADYYDGYTVVPPLLPFPDTAIWSDATYTVTPEQRGIIAQQLSTGAEAQQLQAAGYLQMRVYESTIFSTMDSQIAPQTETTARERVGQGANRVARFAGYVCCTEAQCSMTVRHPKGVGSGWAGLSSYDWGAIDAKTLSAEALSRCQQSLNPVAIEPGRYTAILSPQAVANFTDWMVEELNKRGDAEDPNRESPFFLGGDPSINAYRSMLGQKILDARITISHNPMDPRAGILPVPGLTPVTWIDRGVLKALGYDRWYASVLMLENLPAQPRLGFMVGGETTSRDEMIETTKRGLFVTRFSKGGVIHKPSLLANAVTRDGLWLIENGKLTKAVKNMRVTESPLFAFNQIEQLGEPVPVFHPGQEDLAPAIVPMLKCRDFSFSATVDAV